MVKKKKQQSSNIRTKQEGRAGFKPYIPLLVLTLILYLLSLLLCAIVFLKSDNTPFADQYIVLGFLLPPAFMSSFLAAKKEKKRGLLTGFLWTLPVHLLLLSISMILGHGIADLTLPLSFVILSIVSMLGGVAGVNHRETLKSKNRRTTV